MLKLNNDKISKELDIVNDLKGKVITQTKKTKFYYCQDDNIYSKIFEKYINKRFKSDKQVPVILTLKGNVYNKPKDIFIDIETIAPLNYNTIMKNMVLLYEILKLIIVINRKEHRHYEKRFTSIIRICSI